MAERNEIVLLDTINGIRLRPAMYVGDTTVRGVHALVFGVLDDCVSEVVSGFGSHVSVTIHHDESIEISDDGRPFPTQPLTAFGGWSNFEFAFQEFVLGAQHRGPRPWRIGCGGLYGVDLTTANALSAWLQAESCNGRVGTLSEYERGVCRTRMTQRPADRTGLRVRFLPDREIFQVIDFSADRIRSRMTDLAGMWPGLTLTFRDHRTDEEERFEFPDGVATLVQLIDPTTPSWYERVFAVSKASEDFRLDVALEHVKGTNEKIRSFVNSIQTLEGGTHVAGFRSGLTRAVNSGLRRLSVDRSVSGDELSRGLRAVVSLWVDDPAFEGPTKTRFAYSAIRGTVESVVYHSLVEQFTNDPRTLNAMIDR